MTAVGTTKRGRGRESLSGSGDSPQLRVRLPDVLRESLSRRAAREGVTVSELARRILGSAAEARPEERVQLELHRTLLAKLMTNFGPLHDLAVRNIESMRSSVRGSQAQAWLNEWQRLLDDAGPELVDAFVGTDEHSVDLRQVSPFAGALTQDERLAAIARARGHETS